MRRYASMRSQGAMPYIGAIATVAIFALIGVMLAC